MSRGDLGWLWDVLVERRQADPSSSYTARLLEAGPERVARKVGEEAAETIIAGVRTAFGEEKQELVEESADLLYHLLVFLLVSGVTLEEVVLELERRHRQTIGSGDAEEGRVDG